MYILLFLVLHWYLSLFSQTFFLHRYCSHKMFTLSPAWERFFYYMTLITQGPSFLNPRAYATLHRNHHMFSDQEGDPHSPVAHKNVMKMMYFTATRYVEAQRDPEGAKDVVCDPALDNFGDSWIVRIGWGTLYFVIYCLLAPSYWYFLLLPIHFLMGPIQGAVVNWCGHKYGYQNFDNKDHSRNTLFVDLFLMGELYQNNHHFHPKRSNFAHRWFEFDPCYPVIIVLKNLGVLKLQAA